jgi:hypothetical protein
MMTPPATAQIQAENDRARPARTASRAGLPSNRRPLEKILPKVLIDELATIAGSATEITPELVRKAHLRLDLEKRFGVSRLRLKNYLQRLSQSGKTTSPAGGADSRTEAKDPSAPNETREPYSDRLFSHRRRQASVASILDHTFGPLGKCSPDLWDRRAYLMLVGLVYERLSIGEDELPTDELVALAKVLSESRRIDVRARDAAAGENDPAQQGAANNSTGSAGKRPQVLPDHFADVVRQVYGTNFHEPEQTHSDAAAP